MLSQTGNTPPCSGQFCSNRPPRTATVSCQEQPVSCRDSWLHLIKWLFHLYWLGLLGKKATFGSIQVLWKPLNSGCDRLSSFSSHRHNIISGGCYFYSSKETFSGSLPFCILKELIWSDRSIKLGLGLSLVLEECYPFCQFHCKPGLISPSSDKRATTVSESWWIV